MCCVSVRVHLQRRLRVVFCRPGGLEEKLAVFCSRGKDPFVDFGPHAFKNAFNEA